MLEKLTTQIHELYDEWYWSSDSPDTIHLTTELIALLQQYHNIAKKVYQ